MTAIANTDRKIKKPRAMEMVDKMEYTSKLAAERMFERLKKFREVAGGKPYKGLPVDEQKLTNRYVQVRHDTSAWAKILKENIKIKDDGTVLLPRKFVQSLTQTEKKFRENGL